MKKKILLKVLILIVLVICIMVLSFKFLKSLNNDVYVYVSKVEIEEHEIITENMIKLVEIGFDEKVTFFNNSYDNKEDIVGSITLKKIEKGNVLVDDGSIIKDSSELGILSENGEVNSEFFLEENNRIAFVSIPKTKALGGMLEKGDLIDIIFTSMNDSTGGLYSSLLLQKVLVHKISSNSNSTSMIDIHFEVSPEDALLFSLAKYTGELDLLLTNEKNLEVDIIPVLPFVLYEKLIEAGYLLVDESGRNYGQMKSEISITDLEKEISNAEANLEAAFIAMNAAKKALEAQRNAKTEESVVDMVKRLESAVRDLEGAVSQNKEILENLENIKNGDTND